mgnify:CR=1 FL=1
MVFTRQDLAIDADYIRQLIKESETTIQAEDKYLQYRKVWNGVSVTDPENYTRYQEVFKYIIRKDNEKN